MAEAEEWRSTAEAALAWVLAQVRWDDGPWIPTDVRPDGPDEPPIDRDGVYSGIGGVLHLLDEVRRTRPWTGQESELVDAVHARLASRVAEDHDPTPFDGLAGHLGIMLMLGDPTGAEAAVRRLGELVTPDGWPKSWVGPPRYREASPANDVVLGTAGVLLGAVDAIEHGVPGASQLAGRAADLLLVEQEPADDGGLTWHMIPARYVVEMIEPYSESPNYSHGVAGVVAALASAARVLDRPDLLAAAVAGSRHLVALADMSGDGFVAPVLVPDRRDDAEPVTWSWCHGPTGTSLAFAALDRAGVREVAGEAPASWRRRCLLSVRTSGIPERLRPGFWDNDGRCCGTAGVGEVFLQAWSEEGRAEDLEFVEVLADAVVSRAERAGEHAWWRFLEHRNPEPLLPPGVGWMQGAAGIAAFLFHAARAVEAESRA